MYNPRKAYQCPYLANMYDSYGYPYPHYIDTPIYNPYFPTEYIPFTDEDEMEYYSRCDSFEPTRSDGCTQLKDYGPKPFVINIDEATKLNNNFRTALWTGKHLQVTLMSIKVGEDIGLESHPHLDQFLRIEEGEGIVKMGNSKYNLDFQRRVSDDFAIMIPAGTWHNLINTGNKPLKLYSIYAPPQHPYGTVHETKAIAEAAEENHRD
ncbi:cupin domain-containing protein [Clostridium sp. MB40-C1]|uniref:cupin domain-containing protein n=1 Tax=Clostridium sp. MB40-C1 TaxID=3070996 RepID=UPI0027DEF327|nr:cupin domain-containing protein [Clostridium sp. MB40-C1]WMJ81571.1 cupin domain-containing protein [Clostridium sp. MB40-C1]